MPSFCRCNGSGRCTNCCCKKAGRFCINCLPSRKNRCGNQEASELNRPHPSHGSSAENHTDTTNDPERIPNPSPVVTAVDPVDVPTLPPSEDCTGAQSKSHIADPTDLLPHTPLCAQSTHLSGGAMPRGLCFFRRWTDATPKWAIGGEIYSASLRGKRERTLSVNWPDSTMRMLGVHRSNHLLSQLQ